MIKRQISFLFEDPGFCIDVFCTIAEPVRYYNRDTESGAWYSSTPDWNENGSLIREDLIFEVIADGVVCALDGNGNFEGKKPFVPFCQFRQSLVQSVHTQYPHLQNQEALREKLLSLPDARETVGHGWYWENWLFATDFENTVEEAVDLSLIHILPSAEGHLPRHRCCGTFWLVSFCIFPRLCHSRSRYQLAVYPQFYEAFRHGTHR